MLWDDDDGDTAGAALRHLRHASPVPSRSPSAMEETSPSSAVAQASSQRFSVKIFREAVFDSVSSGPHPPETTRKVSVLHLAAPVDAFAVGCEADAIAQRVLDTMLDRRWLPPQNELFGAPPFTLLSESELLGLFESAERILMQDSMVVRLVGFVLVAL
jgi:hypothetical protein